MSIRSTVYARGGGSASVSFADASQASQEPGNFAWIELVEPGEEDLGVIARSFGLEPRLLEEAVKFAHRSYIEKHEDRLVAVLHEVALNQVLVRFLVPAVTTTPAPAP